MTDPAPVSHGGSQASRCFSQSIAASKFDVHGDINFGTYRFTLRDRNILSNREFGGLWNHGSPDSMRVKSTTPGCLLHNRATIVPEDSEAPN